MSLQWEFIFFFLCAEVAAFFALLIPLPISLKSRFFSWVGESKIVESLKKVLTVITVIIGIMFVDAARTAYDKQRSHESNRDVIQLARAQRNAYMTFFSLFLMLVLNSQVNLIRDNARLTASLAALKKMAENNARAMGSQPGGAEKEIKEKEKEKEENALRNRKSNTDAPKEAKAEQPKSKKDD